MTLPRIPVWVRTALVAGAFAAMAPTLTTACASVCTDDEEQACTDTYNACISAAAAAADDEDGSRDVEGHEVMVPG